jgi:tetratricopeptide (TPR) repeat protein
LTQKRFDEADKEMAFCRELLPIDVNLCVDAVRLLDQLGRKDQANQLFDEVYGAWRKIAQSYPRYAIAHHHLAWLAARCGRKQAEAASHAERAVQLAPSQTVYQDTMAELYFQRGQRTQAEKVARAVLLQQPHRPYYQAQLLRIRAGDTSAPLPFDPDLYYRGRTLLLQFDWDAEGSIIMGSVSVRSSPDDASALWD